MENFKTKIKELAKHVEKQKVNATSEEDVKTALVLPMLKVLGYDPENLKEIKCEYDAGVIKRGAKDGKKVDYAILRDDGIPFIFVECKHLPENLDNHVGQLQEYYNVPEIHPKFAVLTNGEQYRFYTDRKEANKMDSTPFLEFNITKINDKQIKLLADYRKSEVMDKGKDAVRLAKIREAQIFEGLKKRINTQLENPSVEFVTLLATTLTDDSGTVLCQNNKALNKEIEMFLKLTKEAFRQIVDDKCDDLFDRLKDASNQPTSVSEQTSTKQPPLDDRLTEDEKKAFEVIQSIVGTDRELKPHFPTDWYTTINIVTKPKQSIKKHLSSTQSTPIVCLIFRKDHEKNKGFQTFTVQGLVHNNDKWHCQYTSSPKPYYKYTSPQDLLNYKKEILEAVKKYDELNTEFIEKTQETNK
jgi:hypothetical protein